MADKNYYFGFGLKETTAVEVAERSLQIAHKKEVLNADIKESKFQAINNKLILRFRGKEGEDRYMKGKIRLVIYEDEGDYILEYADILSFGNDVKAKGNIACVSHLVNLDETINNEVVRNEHYLDYVEGDFIRWCTTDYLVATTDGKKIYPNKGWVFCSLPLDEDKPKPKTIILLNASPDTTKEGYYSNVLFVNDEDSKQMKLKRGDRVYCTQNSDIPIVVMGKKYIRVPANKILGKVKK